MKPGMLLLFATLPACTPLASDHRSIRPHPADPDAALHPPVLQPILDLRHADPVSPMQRPHEEQIGHYANCDGSTVSPVLNVDDFTCFINGFAAGCP